MIEYIVGPLLADNDRLCTALEKIHYVEGINPAADNIALDALKQN